MGDALSHCSDMLIRYGGHELAAGLTLDAANVDAFRKAINDYARSTMTGDGAEISYEIDTEVSVEEINLKLAEEISYMEPFGVGNPQPLLMLRDAKVQTADSIGDGKHAKFTISGKTALLFGVGLDIADIYEGDTVDAVFKLDVNDFRGIRTEQLLLIDARINRAAEECSGEAELLERIENGQTFDENDDILPTRDDFAAIYREIRGFGEGERTVSMYRLIKELAGNGVSVRGAKLKLALEILSDVGLIGFRVYPSMALSGSELYGISTTRSTEKVNLFGTPRYKNVKSNMRRV
jgi:single-stranded-DNA-specific exonuclease